jgi:hypothetical protein
MKSPSGNKVQKKSAAPPLERFTPLLRFIAYQIVWWLLVYSVKLEELSQIQQLSNLLALVVSMVSLTIILNRKRNTQARRLMLALVVVGYVIDSLWVTAGYMQTRPVFDLASPIKLAPPWLFAIWISFAAISIFSVSLESKSLFATPSKKFATLFALTALGAIGGPLSYMVGEPLGVLILQNRPTSTVLLSIEWAIMFPLILVAAWFVRAQDSQFE